jgi:hypothetical protein
MSPFIKRGRKRDDSRGHYPSGQIRPEVSVTGAMWQRMRSISRRSALIWVDSGSWDSSIRSRSPAARRSAGFAASLIRPWQRRFAGSPSYGIGKSGRYRDRIRTRAERRGDQTDGQSPKRDRDARQGFVSGSEGRDRKLVRHGRIAECRRYAGSETRIGLSRWGLVLNWRTTTRQPSGARPKLMSSLRTNLSSPPLQISTRLRLGN